MLSKHIFILQIFSLLLYYSKSQTSLNVCSQYFRNVHRMGANVQGRLEIPTDDFYPKYKLRIAFSSRIHHMAIRPSRVRDTGTHRDFVVDPLEMQKDGKLVLDVLMRLHRRFGAMPRMTRIIYNNLALCGDPVSLSEIDESFVVDVPSTENPVTVPILIPTNGTTQSWKIKDYGEEEEDIFE